MILKGTGIVAILLCTGVLAYLFMQQHSSQILIEIFTGNPNQTLAFLTLGAGLFLAIFYAIKGKEPKTAFEGRF